MLLGLSVAELVRELGERGLDQGALLPQVGRQEAVRVAQGEERGLVVVGVVGGGRAGQGRRSKSMTGWVAVSARTKQTDQQTGGEPHIDVRACTITARPGTKAVACVHASASAPRRDSYKKLRKRFSSLAKQSEDWLCLKIMVEAGACGGGGGRGSRSMAAIK